MWIALSAALLACALPNLICGVVPAEWRWAWSMTCRSLRAYSLRFPLIPGDSVFSGLQCLPPEGSLAQKGRVSVFNRKALCVRVATGVRSVLLVRCSREHAHPSSGDQRYVFIDVLVCLFLLTRCGCCLSLFLLSPFPSKPLWCGTAAAAACLLRGEKSTHKHPACPACCAGCVHHIRVEMVSKTNGARPRGRCVK